MNQLTEGIFLKFIWGIFMVLLMLPGICGAEERLSVTAGVANMRSGPETSGDVLWQVEQYHPLVVVEKKGNWYRVKDFENDMAWLHESLLGKVASVITIKDGCNVRSQADANSSILFTVEKGVPFKVIEKNGNWIKIEHADGDVGWIYKTLVW
jgi:SH3-like domain-containing protein